MEKKKILVVDDTPAIGELVKHFLESQNANYEVACEISGRAGLLKTQQWKPDFIFLDIQMEDMSGDRVAQELREDPATANIPIVFLTGMVTKQEAAPTKGIVGGNRFLAKPLDFEEMIKCIEEWIGK